MEKTALTVLALAALLAGATPPKPSEAAQATLTWTINATAATETIIERRQETDPPDLYQEIATVKTPDNTYTDAKLEPEKIYCWRIYSKNVTTVSQKTAPNCLLVTPSWTAILYLK